MRIGAMNHPGRPLTDEIRWIGTQGFDFIDLTVEPPCTRAESLNAREILDLAGEFGLGLVGHTSPFLPFASPYEPVRQAAVDVVVRALDLFSELNVTIVNMHVQHQRGAESEAENIEYNRWSFERASREADARGIRLMLEHFGRTYSDVGNLRKILDELPAVGFHLDIGHANLWQPRNWTAELLEAFGDRLCHVHVSDNHGGDRDEHLPLGAGNIDWGWAFGELYQHNYDGTVTTEIFSRNRQYLIDARDHVRQVWDRLSAGVHAI